MELTKRKKFTSLHSRNKKDSHGNRPLGSKRQNSDFLVPTSHSLVLRDLTKRYGSFTALDKVNLEVTRGEFLTFLGPSGSGKTTILMMIAGFTPPTEGEIRLNEELINHVPPEKRNFGMVFQGYALFPHMDVFNNVAYPLKVRKIAGAKIRERVNSTLDLVQLTGFEKRLPKELSGGQQQRVALARALVFQPDFLLLDEPLGALDRKLRADVQIELKALHQHVGTSFIYVTHDQEEALSMSDRIAIINAGQLVQVGEPVELYERPVSRFVADFLGKSNFIRGEVCGKWEGGFVFKTNGNLLYQKFNEGKSYPQRDVLIALRPEKIRIMKQGSADKCRNSVAGSIVNWTYLGSTVHFIVDTTELGRLDCIAPAWGNMGEPQAGRKVLLTWEPDASVVIIDE